MDDLVSLSETIQKASTILADGIPGEESQGPSTSLQVLVLGTLGAGKSAVLNTLIGHPVLPTAEGGATRFPLIIDIERNKHIAGDGVRGKMGSNMNLQSAVEIRKVVQSDMKRWLSSRNQEDQQRHLIIQSSSAPPLRLIDLPGLESRASDLDNMVLDNAGGDVILLVVLPATGAKEASAARVLKMAQDLDHEGSRTLGVITKLDQVSDDKAAISAVIELLTGQGPPTTQNFPWVAVIGQPPNDKGVDPVSDYLNEGWKLETETLGSILRANGGKGLESTLGREGLLRTLARQLRKRMKERIPKLMNGLESRTQEVEDELLRLGDTILSTTEGSRAVALELCRNFDTKFVEHVDGGEDGGAKMVEKFVGSLPGRFRALPLDQLFSMDNVKKVTMEADGYQPYLTSPEKGLRLLIKRSLDLAKQPGLQCVDEVHKILMDVVTAAGNTAPSLIRFPPLKRELMAIASSTLEHYRTEARTMVNSLVDMERVFIPPGHFMDAAVRRYDKFRREDELSKKQAAGQRRTSSDVSAPNDDAKQPGRITQAMNNLRGKSAPPPPPPPPAPPQELAGFLWKVSSKGGWSKRWFALSDKTARLYYVKKPDEKTPRGVVPLGECLIEDIVSPDEYPAITGTSDPLRGSNQQNAAALQGLVFKISNKVPYKNVVKVHQNLILRAENMTEKQLWVLRMKALTKVEQEDAKEEKKEAANEAPEAEASAKDEGNGLPPPVGKPSGEGSAGPPEKGALPTRRINDPEEELKYMATEVRHYVEVVLLSLSANIPKAVVLTQVERAKENMLTKLYTTISKLTNEKIAELLEEDPDSKGKREKAQKQQGALASLKRLLSLHEARASAEEANAAPSVKESPLVEDWRIAFQQAGGGRRSAADDDDEAPSRVSQSRRGRGGGPPSDQSSSGSSAGQGGQAVRPVREAPPPPPSSVQANGPTITRQASPLRQTSPSRGVPNGQPEAPPPSQTGAPMGAPMVRRPNRLPPSVPGGGPGSLRF